MLNARKAVVLLGPPASGKTSVSNELARRAGVEALRTGHLLRREIARGSAVGKRIQREVEQGQLAPTESVVEVLAAAVVEAEGGILVFDGFPRSEAQIEPFLELCKAIELELLAVLVLTLGEEEVHHRLLGRRICPKCGAAYHMDYSPPEREGSCDQCGGELVRREDDTPERIARRLAGYEELTAPVIDYFEAQHGQRTRRVAADGTPEETLARVTGLMGELGVL
jgi:adenylate kinase